MSYSISSEDFYNILNSKNDNNPNEINNIESKINLENKENKNNQQILDNSGKMKLNEEFCEINHSQNSKENIQINFNNNHTNLLQSNKNINKNNIISLDKFVYFKKSPEIEHIDKDPEDKIKNIKVTTNNKNVMREINYIPLTKSKEGNKNVENFVFLANNLKNLYNNKVKKKENEITMEEEKMK